MGLDAECTARVGRKASVGKAHLEGESLQFRGDFRLDIPFERIKDASVDGAALVVVADEEVRLELGAQVAERWMKLIKQPKGLFEKLEIGPTSRVAVVDVNDSLFVSSLRERAGSVTEGRVPEGAEVVIFGADTREALRKVSLLRTRMGDTGTLWIVRPKASKLVSEADVLGAAREAGLVDTKVVALSRLLTAHKCVVPLEMRGQARRRAPILTIPPSAPVLGREPAGAKAKSEKPPKRSTLRPAAVKERPKGKEGKDPKKAKKH
jgi:hypothetical protein